MLAQSTDQGRNARHPLIGRPLKACQGQSAGVCTACLHRQEQLSSGRLSRWAVGGGHIQPPKGQSRGCLRSQLLAVLGVRRSPNPTQQALQQLLDTASIQVTPSSWRQTRVSGQLH